MTAFENFVYVKLYLGRHFFPDISFRFANGSFQGACIASPVSLRFCKREVLLNDAKTSLNLHKNVLSTLVAVIGMSW